MTKRKTENEAGVPPEIQNLTFEDSFRSLEEIVNQLEGGQAGLEDSIEIYARGMLLKRHCEQKLSAAREQIEKIVMEPDGGVKAAPAEID